MLDIKWEKIVERVVYFGCAVVCVLVYMKCQWLRGLDGDNAPQTYAAYAQIATSIFNGEVPWWNPYIWGGIPQMGSPISLGFYPINWLLCILFYNHTVGILSYAIIPCNIAIHIVIYYTGMVMIMNKIIRLDKIIACMLASLSILSFSFMSFLSWIVYFDGFAWFPLLVYFAYQSFEKKSNKYIIGLGIIFGIEALISVSVALILCVAFICFMCINYAISEKKVLRNLIILLKSGVLGIFIASPAIISTAVYLFNSTRYVPDVGYLSFEEKIPFELFNIYKCELNDVLTMFKTTPEFSFLSINIVLVIFAIMAFSCSKKEIFIKWVKFCLLFAFLYSISFIVPEIIYYVPLINNLREPFMYACFFQFFLTLLAGIGYRESFKDFENGEKIDFNLVMILLMISVYNLLPHANKDIYDLVVSIGVLLLTIIMFVNVNTTFNRIFSKVLVVFLIIMSVVMYVKEANIGAYTEKTATITVDKINEEHLLEFQKIKDLKEYDRIVTWSEKPCMPENQGSVIGVRDVIGYYNPLPQNNMLMHNGIDLYKRCQLQGIKYLLMNTNSSKDFIDYFETAYPMFSKAQVTLNLHPYYNSTETDVVDIYELEEVKAGWGVVNVVSDMGKEQNLSWINDISNNLYETAIVSEKAWNNENLTATSIKVDVTDVKNNSISYRANADGSFLLVTTQGYYPGWEVYVDGDKQEIIIVDQVNCGVIIDEGIHSVEFVYRPIYIYGVVMFQIIVSGVYICYKQSKKKKRERRE